MQTLPDGKAAYESRAFQQAFDIGNTKMHQEINEGRLKARYLGRKLLIAHDDAMAWFEGLPARPAHAREAA